MRNKKTLFMVQFALLLAIEALFCFTALGSIPRNVKLAEAPSFGKPIIFYDIASRGAQSYLQVAKEFLAHEP